MYCRRACKTMFVESNSNSGLSFNDAKIIDQMWLPNFLYK